MRPQFTVKYLVLIATYFSVNCMIFGVSLVPRRLRYCSRSLTMRAKMFERQLPPNTVLVLSGVTAVGKSAVALDLCQKVNGEIIISDSVQVYQHLNIGSTKPTIEEMARVPHHLVNMAHPSKTITTGDYCRAAGEAIRDVLSRGKVPVLVGGSTMWIQWLVRGIPDAPKATAEVEARVSELIGELENAGRWDDALQILLQHDPVRGSKITVNDWYRLRRYLEIAVQILEDTSGRSTGKSKDGGLLDGTRVSNVAGEVDFRTVFLSEDRTDLYHTIDTRCVDLLKMGLISEITDLLLTGNLQPEFPVSKAIGYRQTIDYLARDPSIVPPPKKSAKKRAPSGLIDISDHELDEFLDYLA
jgi:tRNA dimethylallyltransferase